MMERFIRSLAASLVAHKGYLPALGPEGAFEDGSGYALSLEAPGMYTLLEILDGERLPEETLRYRLERHLEQLKQLDPHAGCRILLLLVYNGAPGPAVQALLEDKRWQEALGRRYLRCSSVSLAAGTCSRHYRLPWFYGGVEAAVREHLKTRWQEFTGPVYSEAMHEARLREEEIPIRAAVPWLTYGLTAVNILVYGALMLAAGMDAGAYSDLLMLWGAKLNGNILAGETWRLLTPVFLHADLMHLLVNCYSLNIVGISAERTYGRLRFMILYSIAGITGNIASLAFSTHPGVGASGAIFGLLGAMLCLSVQKPVLFRNGYGGGILAMVLLNLFYGFSSTGIDNYAHLGGLVGGFLIACLVSKPMPAVRPDSRLLAGAAAVLLGAAGLWYGFHKTENVEMSYITEMMRLETAQDWSGMVRYGTETLAVLSPESDARADLLYYVTRAQAIQGDYDGAEKSAASLAALDPAFGNFLLGLVYFDQREFEASRTALEASKTNGFDAERADAVLEQIRTLENAAE